jgi:hypothetical protein
MIPKDVSDQEVVFGGTDVSTLMPPYGSIPNEFKREDHYWCQWQRKWFYTGLTELPLAKQNIDVDKAMRHLSAIQHSFTPKHQHKCAAVAFLASQWFVTPG